MGALCRLWQQEPGAGDKVPMQVLREEEACRGVQDDTKIFPLVARVL